jgi:hypothetical protein
MVAACSEALAEGRCEMAAALPESARPEAVALVLWQGDGYLQVTIRVGRGGGQWVARALTFSERDSISERWTTVGLTVATLVGESHALEEPPTRDPAPVTPVPSSAPTPSVPSPSKAPPQGAGERAPRWLASGGGLAGPGWDAGGWQRGGWLAVTYRLAGVPLQAHATGSYAFSDGPRVQGQLTSTVWMTAAVGAGVFGTFRPLSVTGSAELQLGYRRIDVDFNGRSASDRELPVQLRALASAPATGMLAGTFGMVLRLPPQHSNESGGLTLRGASLAAEALLGLEVRL